MSDVKPKHSRIGASSMYRWKNCPGSVKLSAGIVSESSIYAQEGTAAHEVVGLALERAFSENVSPRLVLQATNEALFVYTDYIENLKGDNPVYIEHSFDLNDIFPGMYGTADCVIFDEKTKILHVIDYKHGMGIPVDVKNNLQLQYYALGAVHTLPHPCREVQMTIVQPRCYHPDGKIRHWKVSALHFIEFELELIAAGKQTQKKKATLFAGEHCIFCPAKTTCPQKEKQGSVEAKREFKFYKDPKDEFTPVAIDTNSNDLIDDLFN